MSSHKIYLIGTLLVLFSCEQTNKIDWSSKISGVIEGSAPSGFASGLTFSAGLGAGPSVSTLTCSTAIASIYEVDTDGSIINPAIASTTIDPSGRYAFRNTESLGIDFRNTNIRYLVKIEGCSSEFSRPLTGYKNQEVNLKTSLIERLARGSSTKKLDDFSIDEIDSILPVISNLTGTTEEQLYNDLLADAGSKSLVENTLGLDADDAGSSEPEVSAISGPSTVVEGIQSTFSVSASHWNSSYTLAYRWYLDGVPVGNTASYNYIPRFDSASNVDISYKVGKDDGYGDIDTTLPYAEETLNLAVTNTDTVTFIAGSTSFDGYYGTDIYALNWARPSGLDVTATTVRVKVFNDATCTNQIYTDYDYNAYSGATPITSNSTTFSWENIFYPSSFHSFKISTLYSSGETAVSACSTPVYLTQGSDPCGGGGCGGGGY